MLARSNHQSRQCGRAKDLKATFEIATNCSMCQIHWNTPSDNTYQWDQVHLLKTSYTIDVQYQSNISTNLLEHILENMLDRDMLLELLHLKKLSLHPHNCTFEI